MLKLLPVLLIVVIAVAVIGCQPTKEATETKVDTQNTTPDIEDSSGEDIMEEEEKEETHVDQLVGFTWSVAYIQELDARFAPKKTASIAFKGQNKINIGLSVNGCFGSYTMTKETIKMTEEGCTEVCCDDDFDKQLLALIRGNEFSYTLNGKKLTLSATNAKIVLSKNVE